jgi:uncharacterized protein YjbJ (UPF0337 family)
MSVNQRVLEGNWNKIQGKLRDRWGELSVDDLESTHGDVEELIGTIEWKTGNTREAVEQYLEELTNSSSSMVAHAAETVRECGHSAQEALHGVTKQACETVKSGYAMSEQAVRNRPVESLAVCFGAGLITGVVVGLTLRLRWR